MVLTDERDSVSRSYGILMYGLDTSEVLIQVQTKVIVISVRGNMDMDSLLQVSYVQLLRELALLSSIAGILSLLACTC